MRFLIDGGESFKRKYRAPRIYGDDLTREPVTGSRGARILRNALIAFDSHAAGLSLRGTAAVICAKDRIICGDYA